jgi:hypothetical protein
MHSIFSVSDSFSTIAFFSLKALFSICKNYALSTPTEISCFEESAHSKLLKSSLDKNSGRGAITLDLPLSTICPALTAALFATHFDLKEEISRFRYCDEISNEYSRHAFYNGKIKNGGTLLKTVTITKKEESNGNGYS